MFVRYLVLQCPCLPMQGWGVYNKQHVQESKLDIFYKLHHKQPCYVFILEVNVSYPIFVKCGLYPIWYTLALCQFFTQQGGLSFLVGILQHGLPFVPASWEPSSTGCEKIAADNFV